MAHTPCKYDWDENGVRVRIDTRTGEKRPVNELVEQAAKEGRLVTMEQAMANERKMVPDEGINGVDRWTSNGYGLMIDGIPVKPISETDD